ncbi:hypothetical protein [Primorskyibacter sp. S87]|uniref:hypothetical protein n=1 Tax=Primorskyibacter sp. S87 TaxID=3415126 RepID=UPI003C79C452
MKHNHKDFNGPDPDDYFTFEVMVHRDKVKSKEICVGGTRMIVLVPDGDFITRAELDAIKESERFKGRLDEITGRCD